MANPPAFNHRPSVVPLSVRTREAAAMLGIGVRTLFNLTAPRGPIRAARVGGALLYPVEELRRWLSETANCESPREDDDGAKGGEA